MSRKITFVNSQRKVNCGLCDDVLIFKNLSRHFSIFHKGETPREKAPEGTKSLKTFFVGGDKENQPPQIFINLDENEIQNENDIQNAIETQSKNEKTIQGTVIVSSYDIDVENKEIQSNNDSITLDSPNSNESEIFSKLNEIQLGISNLEKMHTKEDLIQTFDERMKNFLENVERLHIGSTSSENKLASSLIYIESNLHSACAAESIDEIMDRLSNWKLHFPNEAAKKDAKPDGLYCTYCTKEISETKGIPGVLHYDFSYGDNFKSTAVLPREFRNFKIKMRVHMDCPYHADKVVEKLNLEKMKTREEFLTRNEKAGMTCARNAYKAIYSNHSYLSYEVEMAKDAANRVEVGELNHSADFCSDMVDCLYSCLTARFREQIFLPLKGTNRPSPITLIFDKYTPMHRTLNIIAANTYICGSLETVFVDCPVVKHHNAKGLAENLSSSVTKVYGNSRWKKR